MVESGSADANAPLPLGTSERNVTPPAILRNSRRVVDNTEKPSKLVTQHYVGKLEGITLRDY